MSERPFETLARAPVPHAELAYEAIVDIGERVSLGQSPLGERRIVPILGGTFSGPGLRGIVLPGGADRQLVRRDGVRLLEALYEMQTDDGIVFTVHNRVKIQEIAGERLYAMSLLEITAPEGPCDWMNRFVFVGTLTPLMPARRAVLITVYKVL